MKYITSVIAVSLLTFFAGGCDTTVEEVNYKLISKTENFEIIHLISWRRLWQMEPLRMQG